MNKAKKYIALMLCIAILFTEKSYALTAYTLQEALYYGQAKSFFKGDLRKSTMAIKEKQKAIIGAKAGGSLSLSLDFMKIFEDDPPYQKTFSNLTKGPTAVYNYNVECLKQPFTLRKTAYDVKTAYFSVYKSKVEAERKQERLAEETQKYMEGQSKKNSGEIDEDTLKDQKKKMDDAALGAEKAAEDYANKIQKLNDRVYLKNKLKYSDYTELKPFLYNYCYDESKLNSLFSSNETIGFVSLTTGYDFQMNLKRARVGSDELPKLIDDAIKVSWEIKSLEEELKIDECYINACMDLYKKEYGYNSVAQFDSMIKGGIGNIDDLDFTLKYDKFVEYLIGRYGENWSPYFKISLLFFSIKIPKLFKYDEYDGVRFLEDSRYELQQRVMQFLQLLMDIETQKKTVAEQVSTLFYDINNLDRDYEGLRQSFDTLKAEYEKNQVKYKNGLVKADILIGQKDELNETDDKINDTLMQMNEKILELDYLTGGKFMGYTRDYGEPVPQTDSSPFKAMALDDMVEAVDEMNRGDYTITWSVSSAAENDSYVSTVDFAIAVEGTGFDCDKYQIVTSDGLEVSEKLSISEKFRHFATALDDKSAIKIKFYRGESAVYTGIIDGYGNIGKIIIE